MKRPTAMEIALAEIREEDNRAEVERLKQQVRQSRQTLLYRIIYVLRYMKPTIKWEYRK